MEISKLKSYIESANINFLFGSGLAIPFLSTLGDIETWLTELAKDKTISDDVRIVIRASIYREYFLKVILKNANPATDIEKYKTVIDGYKNFLMIWNDINWKEDNGIITNDYTNNNIIVLTPYLWKIMPIY